MAMFNSYFDITRGYVLNIFFHGTKILETRTSTSFWGLLSHMQPMVLVYESLHNWVNWTRANVGIHIPAPWVAYGYGIVCHSSKGVVIIG